MKRISAALIIMLCILAVFTGCNSSVIEYKDPFAGKSFFENMGSSCEKSMLFKNGEVTISDSGEVVTDDLGACTISTTVIEGPTPEHTIVAVDYYPAITRYISQTYGIYSYSFSGESKRLVLTPKKMHIDNMVKVQLSKTPNESGKFEWSTVAPDAAEDTENYEYFAVSAGRDLYSYEEYLAELNRKSPGPENEVIARIMFSSVTYNYDFYAADAVYPNGRLVLSTENVDVPEGVKNFVFTEVFAN